MEEPANRNSKLCSKPVHMYKILVLGPNGAGKSTLSVRLSEKLNLPLYHLDKIFVKPGWIHISEENKVAIQREIVRCKKWIIDGNWTSSLDIRLESADTVLFLDYPKWLCLYRVIKRGLVSNNRQSFDKQAGVKNKVNWTIINRVLAFQRTEISDKINQNALEKRIIILKNPKETEKFVASLTQQ